MRGLYKFFSAVALAGALLLLQAHNSANSIAVKFPYKQHGLTDRQAAAHLLSRFSYGAKPNEIDIVVSQGLEKWVENQLLANNKDQDLERRLQSYDALNLTNSQVLERFPQGNQVLRMAEADGFLSRDSVNKADRKAYREKLAQYMNQKGLRPQQELIRQFVNQKILRAAYSNNQLQEVLTDFWFNHFNVAFNKNQCAEFIPAYERDVIRPNALGKFETLLISTAKSPAMLTYLDNFSSVGSNDQSGNQPADMMLSKMAAEMADSNSMRAQAIKRLQKNRKAQGLNENYAREVMELHTLGVDAGYTQKDVTEAARVLTGWTLYPMGGRAGAGVKNIIDRIGEENLLKRGFVHEGDFLFAANRHDNGEKVVLGKKFDSGSGYEEGIQLLKMLAHHSSTAKFISRKLAIRFVSDNPSTKLVDRMAKTFLDKDGDIKQVLITMVSSPEFWSKESLRQKTKSPFELAISVVRALDAEIIQPYQVYSWVSKMGQKMYYYQAPTGFPDKGQYWINTGSLLNRMNFGLALAGQKIPGIRFDLAGLNKNREPESAEAALTTYSKILLPERDLNETVKRLAPMLTAPELEKKVERAAARELPGNTNNDDTVNIETDNTTHTVVAKQKAPTDSRMLAQVVGVIIGSPEYQRR